jgi:hypothetical protein
MYAVLEKVRDGEDAIASTRDACATEEAAFTFGVITVRTLETRAWNFRSTELENGSRQRDVVASARDACATQTCAFAHIAARIRRPGRDCAIHPLVSADRDYLISRARTACPELSRTGASSATGRIRRGERAGDGPVAFRLNASTL